MQSQSIHEARLKGLSDRMNEAEFVLSRDGRIVEVNARALETYGYSRSEFLGLTIFDLRARDGEAQVRADLERAWRDGARFETLHRRRDGSLFPVGVSSRGFTVEEQDFVHSLVHDLTEQHAARAEHARLLDQLERSERRYRTLFEHLGEELSVFEVARGPDGQWRWGLKAANAIGRRWFEDRYERALGMQLTAQMVDPTMASHIEHTDEIMAGQPFEVEAYFPRRDRWYRSSSFAIDERTVVASAFDITALRRAQQALEQASHAANRANELKSQFLANMSHEIRTPLSAVLGLARLGIDEHDPARLHEYMQLIERSGTGLLELINDILDFSKIEAGRLSVERSPFRLRRLLDDVHDTLEPAADSRGLALRLHVADDVPHVVCGDPLRVRQVVSNLLSNALKFTERGSVDLEVTLDEAAAVRVTVRDTGVGVSAEAATRLFETFMQQDASTTRRFGGTGLGLAISRQLARLMGGELRHVHHPPPGAAFVFETNLRAATPDELRALERIEQSAGPVRPPRSLQGRRVLLVEDNKVNQLLANTLLRKAGMDVALAGDGAQALEALVARHEGFDVVLMDLQMPVMDGLEATRQARLQLGHACPPIVAMTANAMAEDEARTIAAGMCAHLTKPIDVARLYETLARLITTDPAPGAAAL